MDMVMVLDMEEVIKGYGDGTGVMVMLVVVEENMVEAKMNHHLNMVVSHHCHQDMEIVMKKVMVHMGVMVHMEVMVHMKVVYL